MQPWFFLIFKKEKQLDAFKIVYYILISLKATDCKLNILCGCQIYFITIQWNLFYAISIHTTNLFWHPLFPLHSIFLQSIQFVAELIPFIPSNLPLVNVWSYYVVNEIMMKISQRFKNWHWRLYWIKKFIIG